MRCFFETLQMSSCCFGTKPVVETPWGSMPSLPSVSSMQIGAVRTEILTYQEGVPTGTESTPRQLKTLLQKLRLKNQKSVSDQFNERKLEELDHMDRDMCCQIASLPCCQALESSSAGASKSQIREYYNYILMDPRTQNLSSTNIPESERWKSFCDSIFYIGKGWGTRPYAHLKDAARFQNQDDNIVKMDDKIGRILEIWQSGQGVLLFDVFKSGTPEEALCREAAMIHAIGLNNLTNSQRGTFFGQASGRQKSKLGTSLLFKAYKMFLVTDVVQLRPEDLRL